MLTFSVVLNCYNYGDYVQDALDSVFRQRYSQDDVEIIVIDDGSTDNTSEAVQRYGNRVKYIRQDNRGQAAAINRGVRESKGEIIALLDADDYFRPTKLEHVAHLLEKDARIDTVYNRYDLVNSSGSVLAVSQPSTLDTNHLRDRAMFWRAGGVPTSCISVRGELLRQITIPEEFRICADSYLLVVLGLIGAVRAIPCALTAYRSHQSNAYLSKTNEARRAMLATNRAMIAQWVADTYGLQLYQSLWTLREAPYGQTFGFILREWTNGQRFIANSNLPFGLKLKETAKLWAAAISWFHTP